jgi:hypothetical protein
MFEFVKKTLSELVPCVEVTLVSKFHSILCLIAQKSRLGRKCLVSNKLRTMHSSGRTSPGLGQTSVDWGFQLNIR